ncbi:2-hydroxy-3-keto-5-methylthiopentenyl-1-phosphate phosphatase [Alkalihalobacillus pseudalcaliphilus]|nr:2-hydroxy-3-keto-5-methylthiopentenyl-1-phosphate phosphatase [Alkalihalobacillus pseudalcaliphilus]KMK76087.1 2-hydroxy-3-keto-5-methylthiopentenyl-1-phosphate phosphatase [Alkalihalobacillus pseudalcaliphilus]
MTKPVIYCDFDGTITESDNIVALMEKFGPNDAEAIKEQILSQSISIKEGVGQLFRLIKSNKKPEMVSYLLDTVKVRPGFQELLHYCKQESIRFYVVSGGIDFFVYPLLARFDLEEEQIYCNGHDAEGPVIEITWPYPCDTDCHNECGCCKPSIIRTISEAEDFNIVIGDSVTDFEAAKKADHVFARARLEEECQKQDIPYTTFSDFFDILNHIKKLEVIR